MKKISILLLVSIFFIVTFYNCDPNSQNQNTSDNNTTQLTIKYGPDTNPNGGRILLVGSTREYKKPSEAALVAVDNDMIVIDGGVYENDTAIWRANNLIIFCNSPQKAHLKFDGDKNIPAEGKAIWVIKGNNTTVSNIEFSGCKVYDSNGAGIRQEGDNLTVKYSYFHNNQNGILTTSDCPNSTIIIEYSEFAYNGDPGWGQTHNLYINKAKKLIFRYNYSHHTTVGHNLKSRAYSNYILYNRIMDEVDGSASFQIDLPNGGLSYIIGNYIQQGMKNKNDNIIHFGGEGIEGHNNKLYVVNNTIVNDYLFNDDGKLPYSYYKGVMVLAQSGTDVKIYNNILHGVYEAYYSNNATVDLQNNLVYTNSLDHYNGKNYPASNKVVTESPLVDKANFDYRTKPDSYTKDNGIDCSDTYGFSLIPKFHYVHPCSRKQRDTNNKLDIGAYEIDGENSTINTEEGENFHNPTIDIITTTTTTTIPWDQGIPLTDVSKYSNYQGNVIMVGANHTYKKPSEASSVAKDGDLIKIEPGDYENDATSWTANNLIIIGNGGFAHLKSNGTCAEGKAIWVIKGTNTTVENIRFSGAKVPDNNGAGIRQEGANLTVRSCYFEDNQNGILTSDNSNSEILIEYSEFSSNGYGDGYTHNLYINHVKKLTFQYNYSHHTKIGHNLKTRAFNNYILYNRIMDEKEGTASYQIDIPNGGLSFVVGNVIEQGINAENNSIISYGREGITNGNNNFFLINNTIVNDKGSGYFVNLDSTTVLKSVNNIFYGVGEVYAGIATNNISQATNIATQNAIFADKDNYDYKLVTGASPINGGSDAGYYDTFNLNPQYIYYHKSNKANRVVKDVIDMGAFEF